MSLLNKVSLRVASDGAGLRSAFSVGDVVMVHYEDRGGFWKTRRFTGICISKSLKGFNERYTLRNIIDGVAIELSFYKCSNIILKLEILPIHKMGKVRKSSLFFIRKRPLNDSKVKLS